MSAGVVKGGTIYIMDSYRDSDGLRHISIGKKITYSLITTNTFLVSSTHETGVSSSTKNKLSDTVVKELPLGYKAYLISYAIE